MGLALALLLLMASVIKGEYGDAIDLAIRLQSGHLQLRTASYDEVKTSLKWEDLIENPDQIAGQIASLGPVAVATPRLYASGFVTTRDESDGVRVIGIDPASAANDPYRQGMQAGEFLTPDDREGLLIGLALANRLGLTAGDRVSLSVNTSNGDVDEQSFIRPGHLQHRDQRLRRLHRLPPAGQGAGLHPSREPRQHDLRLAEGHEPDGGGHCRAAGAGLRAAHLAADERADRPDRRAVRPATWPSST